MVENDEPQISMEEFRFMADRAGLGMDQSELEHLKPIYELCLEYTALVPGAVLRLRAMALPDV